MNTYELSKDWFDWCYDNPDVISPTHTAMYFFIIEHCNRLGWKPKFGLPMEMTKDAIGISNYRTFSKVFADLVDWGFIVVHQKSKNQYSSNIIGLVKNTKATTKARDKALQKQVQKQVHGIVGIDKPYNNITIEQIDNILSVFNSLDGVSVNEALKLIHGVNKTATEILHADDDKDFSFDEFWKMYPNKVGKEKAGKAYEKLSVFERQKIRSTLPSFIKNKPFATYTHPHPTTYLNGKRWDDEINPNDLEVKFSCVYSGANGKIEAVHTESEIPQYLSVNKHLKLLSKTAYGLS